MGRKKTYFNSRSHVLSIAKQGARLKRLIPDSKLQLNKNISLTWTGTIQPGAASDVYTIRIRYKLSKRPIVHVVTPDLLPRNGERMPHLFEGDDLCLFRRKYNEWKPSMALAETILPWSSLWLLYYEIWHATGVWCGSKQEHPRNGKVKEAEQSAKDNIA